MQRGYTLTELLVVLTILGVMAAAAVPALGVWVDYEPTAAERVAVLFRDSRSSALRMARPVRLILDDATGRWLLMRPDSVLAEGTLDLGRAVLFAGHSPVVVAFRPTGGAVGGTVSIRQGDDVTVVRVDPWTGEVSVEAP